MAEPVASTDRDQPARRRPRLRVLVVGAVVLAAGAGGVAAWRARSAESVPYADPASTGLLTLCSASGERITGGRVDEPFAAVVLGATPLQPARDGSSSASPVATLFAYQPRPGVEAEEFSGTAISATYAYADPALPATLAGERTWSVRDFTTAFPADLEGYVQLRLLLGSPEAGTVTTSYDTADIRVDGDRWRVVRGGDAPCSKAADAVPER